VFYAPFGSFSHLTKFSRLIWFSWLKLLYKDCFTPNPWHTNKLLTCSRRLDGRAQVGQSRFCSTWAALRSNSPLSSLASGGHLSTLLFCKNTSQLFGFDLSVFRFIISVFTKSETFLYLCILLLIEQKERIKKETIANGAVTHYWMLITTVSYINNLFGFTNQEDNRSISV
jgi:hypothetical protein